MSSSSENLQQQRQSSYLSGENMEYVDGLYEDYLLSPDSVPLEWQKVFESFPIGKEKVDVPHREIRAYFAEHATKKPIAVSSGQEEKQFRVTNLINAYRARGHHAAALDPLQMAKRLPAPSLELAFHQLDEKDLDTVFYVGPSFHHREMPLRTLYQVLRETYCGSIGIEYMHISNTEETQWLQQTMESARGCPSLSSEKKRAILQDLIAADGLESYLGTRYVGQKRFSLEGGDALIPMLKELINQGGDSKVKEIVIGMAHRGRLNVLVNVLGKAPHQLFQEFEGKVELERTGDVKYHMGYASEVRTSGNAILQLELAFNPSHLEIIGPVVEGAVRSRLEKRQDVEEKCSVLPVIIHGDAAFAGQGVVMETFNFSQARGYATGGTVHIIINNQIGFTTSNPLDARSTLYCTDVAKMVQAPILHVNGDDPEAVIFATQIAFNFREKFKRDVVLDLVCYRRQGHNEADEPSVTQPAMYKKIKSMKPVRENYAKTLLAQGVIAAGDMEQEMEKYRLRLEEGLAVVDIVNDDFEGKVSTDWTPYWHTKWTEKVDTAISEETLAMLSQKLLQLPEGFTLHPVVKRMQQEREKMSQSQLAMNWGYAETMAYASLLQEGYGVRLSGQDSGRGTFAHRHAVLYDTNTGEAYIPLASISPGEGKKFTVVDSVLSEEAVLAFEYGYASSDPLTLVLWEAQFGDFANGAQVVIDQFISSGEQKWGRLCGLVMLLPHGYEGQGPEHSSARLERYMQLCAQKNIQVCTPTTPSQIFHLLRRQILRKFCKPLIIMTPKSLLRHKLAVSPLSDMTQSRFHTVIGEIDSLEPKSVTKVVLCCGKVYYDLLQKRRDSEIKHVAIIRIEQLYPFPRKVLHKILAKYPHAKEVVWCQEEPQNQGVWFASCHNIEASLQPGQTLQYAGRGFAAAPAVGLPKLHAKEQEDLVQQALGLA